ncbi:MAG TPA: hypothetical protein VH268_08335 [Solirubrobacterales bacterium]|nr:hypothetical protein [Solirubrobacterales bacterium]
MDSRRRGTLRGARIAFATVVLLGAGSLAAFSPLATGATKKTAATTAAPFCSNPVVDNYRAPLQALQPIPALPESGVLRFAPTGTTIAATGPQGVLVGGSNIGFRLANAAAVGTPTKTLNWTVLERLTRLTKNGHGLHPAGLKRINLRQLPAGKHRGLTFPVAATPAIYSLEVTIQNHRGRLLGRYGEYIRVVSRTVNVGITLAAYDNVVPGAYLESCFENHGSATVAPTGTSLERFDASSWRPVVVGTQYSPAQTPILRTLGPGEADRIATLVPPSARPGLYRLTATGSTELSEPVVMTAEFGVL